MRRIPKDHGDYSDRAAGSFQACMPYQHPLHQSLMENIIDRNGWQVVEKVTDNLPFDAVIAVKTTMATAGPDGQW